MIHNLVQDIVHVYDYDYDIVYVYDNVNEYGYDNASVNVYTIWKIENNNLVTYIHLQN